MRMITHGDVVAAACALRGLPEDTRRERLVLLIEQAHAADSFRKRKGKAHPLWGNGSLVAVVLQEGDIAPEPFLSDTDYLEALGAVIQIIIDWRHRAH